jgi:hypothetical protein
MGLVVAVVVLVVTAEDGAAAVVVMVDAVTCGECVAVHLGRDRHS